MEKKGYLQSRKGEVQGLRGGKPRCYYTITAYGKMALQQSRQTRNQLWDSIPSLALDI